MITYKDSGVDVERGYEAVKLMKKHAMGTMNQNVLGSLGSFGGFYAIKDYITGDPVLVSGTDGVGTKLKIAFVMDKHDTVGQDCVAMCVDDVVCQGAKPLFFLDYLATGFLEPQKAADIVKGIADGCLQADCALIGGETAEMPGFYQKGEYDLAGFCVGIVDKQKVVNGASIVPGDILIGLKSSGMHSNGFSLARKLLLPTDDYALVHSDELGKTIGEELLIPTRIYAKSILNVLGKINLKGIAHITGGGFIENIPRIFPTGIGCEIDIKACPEFAIFSLLRKLGGLNDHEMFSTFNMGIGMVTVVSPNDVDQTLTLFKENGEEAYVIGKTIEGEGVKL